MEGAGIVAVRDGGGGVVGVAVVVVDHVDFGGRQQRVFGHAIAGGVRGAGAPVVLAGADGEFEVFFCDGVPVL